MKDLTMKRIGLALIVASALFAFGAIGYLINQVAEYAL